MLTLTLVRASLVLTLFTGSWAAEICCPEVNMCFSDDPPFDDIDLPFCPDDMQVSMTVYTRENTSPGQPITRTTIPPIWSASRRTHILIHGWQQDANVTWIHNMKDAVLTGEDHNVIIVDWSGGSHELPLQSASNTRAVGSHIAAVLNNLVSNGGGIQENFYCTGHSLGSHTCGHTGNYSQDLHGIFMDRITGLDPSGPWFEDNDWIVGLNPTCAAFVDVIHTDGEWDIIMNLGTLKPLGHVDFYPNGGGNMPGCYNDSSTCHHMVVIDYYHESIASSCHFNSRHKCTDPYNLPGSCEPFALPQQAMGYISNDPSYQTSGIFYLTTNDEEPFCMG